MFWKSFFFISNLYRSLPQTTHETLLYEINRKKLARVLAEEIVFSLKKIASPIFLCVVVVDARGWIGFMYVDILVVTMHATLKTTKPSHPGFDTRSVGSRVRNLDNFRSLAQLRATL